MPPQARPATEPRSGRVAVAVALRTPIGRFLGVFQHLTAADLGTAVVRAVLERAGASATRAVGELVFGNGRQAGGGPNVARQISFRAGLGEAVPAWTVNMACGSGLKAIALGADAIRAGRCTAVVAGGVESMSGLPFFLPRMREGYRLGHAPVVDGMYQDGFHCPLADMLMGATAEKLAKQLEITRQEQDEYALASQQKAAAAIAAGRFAAEIAPVTVRDAKGRETVVGADEHPRPDTTLAGLAKLPPVFDPRAGTVHAGNSSGITDGAAAVLLVAEHALADLGLEPLAWVGEMRQAGVDPTIMGIGPVPAVRALEQANGFGVSDYDLIELNEAFAAQVIACDRELALPMERVNVNGGAIALGHPIGATGARIVVTLLHEMQRRAVRDGLATLCISGGMGLAGAFHREPS